MNSFLQFIFDTMPVVIEVATLVAVFILAPLGIFRATRSFAGLSLVYASWIFGACL
jgi:hypothetical protein